MKNKEKTLQRIKEMKGKRFLYRNYNVRLEEVQIRGSIVLFMFRHQNGNELKIEKDMDKTDLFLDYLRPAADENQDITEITDQPVQELEESGEQQTKNLPANVEYLPPLLRQNRDLITSLRDMLVEDMKKVRANKEYIPQAKQACNTANSIINLAKLEIQMLRTE